MLFFQIDISINNAIIMIYLIFIVITLITQLDIISACNDKNFKIFFLTIQIFLNSSDF